MDDSVKKRKLAAAKKKLREFQKTQKGRHKADSKNTGAKEETDPEPKPEQKPASSDSESSESLTPAFDRLSQDSVKQKDSVQSSKSESAEQIHLLSNDVNGPDQAPVVNEMAPNTSTPKTSSQNEDLSRISDTSGVSDSSHSSKASRNPKGAPAENGDQSTVSITTQSTERIQQLSCQMNGLFSEASALVNDESAASGSIEELEARNRQLALMLEKHVQANEKMSKQLIDLKQLNAKLESTLEMERKTFEEKLQKEHSSAREQMQVQIETIGILVSEKTELQSTVAAKEKLLSEKQDTIDELCERLQASRDRVAYLERNFKNAADSDQFHRRNLKEAQKEIDRLKLEFFNIKKSNEAVQQQNSELQEKLQQKVSEYAKLEQNFIELKGELERTKLNVQQLQDPLTIQQIDTLLAEKNQLQIKVDQYEEQFKLISQERDEISRKYQEYMQQLQEHTKSLQEQIKALIEGRDQLVNRNKELEIALNELRSSHDSTKATMSEELKAHKELSEKLEKMTVELEELKHKYEIEVSNNAQLSSLLMERESNIMDLEFKVRQLADNQVDNENLLQTMESDKVALNRAMSQNKELKNQLAELQNSFVKMSNDKMELLNKYTSEQHICKELGARLGQQEEELKEVREQLAQKEQLLKEVQKYAEVLQQQNHLGDHHQGNMEEKLREFQEQTPLIETLQKELCSAQDTINALTTQNAELKAQLLKMPAGEANINANSEQFEAMTASVRQLEMERNQVLSILEEQKKCRREAEQKLEELQKQLATMTPATLNGDVINKAQFEALQDATKQLEAKFIKVMREKAELLEKTEQLEHTIMQLQGENDTIAEYITLYQNQRMLLRQRQEEKDDYIARLAREGQEQADKLAQLQDLVVQVLAERDMLTGVQNNNAISNHKPYPGVAVRAKGEISGKLDSSNLEDWPVYTSSESSDSEVESIVGGENGPGGDSSSKQTASPKSTVLPDGTGPDMPAHVTDPTAQKIMHLLSEISSTMNVDSSNDKHFLHCSHCNGPILCV